MAQPCLAQVSMVIKLFPVLEIIRNGGDLQNLGGSAPTETKLLCPDGVVVFHVAGKQRMA